MELDQALVERGRGTPGELSPVALEQVFNALSSSLNPDPSVRGAAEAALRSWEVDSAPGFIGSLISVVEQHSDEVCKLHSRITLC